MSPRLGAFTGMEPLPSLPEDPATLLAYAYAEADPVNKTDPTGLFSVGEYALVASVRVELVEMQSAVGFDLLTNAASGSDIDLGPFLAPSLYDILPDDSNPFVAKAGFRTIVGIGMARRSLRAFHDAGIRRVFTRSSTALRGTGKLTKPALAKIWDLHPFVRGWAAEVHIAATKYRSWAHVGKMWHGFFPIYDFIKGNKAVSLKTARRWSARTVSRLKSEAERIANYGSGWKNGQTVIDDLRLEVRVPPSQLNKNWDPLIQFGKDIEVDIVVLPFPP